MPGGRRPRSGDDRLDPACRAAGLGAARRGAVARRMAAGAPGAGDARGAVLRTGHRCAARLVRPAGADRGAVRRRLAADPGSREHARAGGGGSGPDRPRRPGAGEDHRGPSRPSLVRDAVADGRAGPGGGNERARLRGVRRACAVPRPPRSDRDLARARRTSAGARAAARGGPRDQDRSRAHRPAPAGRRPHVDQFRREDQHAQRRDLHRPDRGLGDRDDPLHDPGRLPWRRRRGRGADVRRRRGRGCASGPGRGIPPGRDFDRRRRTAARRARDRYQRRGSTGRPA